MPTYLLCNKWDECLKHLRYVTRREIIFRPFSHVEEYVHDTAPKTVFVLQLLCVVRQSLTKDLGD
jgi:hypothetical protein